jgi:hypothetical protein
LKRQIYEGDQKGKIPKILEPRERKKKIWKRFNERKFRIILWKEKKGMNQIWLYGEIGLGSEMNSCKVKG